ncbi:MAG: hypothetical protein CVU56_27680 [Deltaproteobacteria bacterium HGW-Deltaproteobacteria-14]|nr:MAG: hypothetical protein CVU56_27680 [Deltaproteobacteria bacterium HGW-Deltaproteobacteria-14]
MTDALTVPVPDAVPWDREMSLAVGELARFHVGALTIVVQRLANEWRATWETTADALSMDTEAECPVTGLTLDEEGDLHRFALRDAPGTFLLRPRLADRAVIIRPAQPFRLMPGGDVDVYVSTALWVAFELVPSGQVLFDVPVSRPSDTWFGPNTLEGELCYVSRTSARLDLVQLPLRPGRAVTRIRVENRGSSAVNLERVHLPAPELQPFIDTDGHVWTQPVEVVLDEHGGAEVSYGSNPSRHAPAAVPVGAPRQRPERHLLPRALSALWT